MTKKRVLVALCATLLIVPAYSIAQQQPPVHQQPPAKQPSPTGVFSADILDSLVAPLALYPDPILSQVLVASTYPLEIVQAESWLKGHSSLSGKALADAAAKQAWDASIQALVMLPDVLKRLNENINWTSDLGNAFLAQQEGVMQAIQRMRQRAQDKGALKSTPQQNVTTTTDNGQNYIVIQPASPELVYVPQYSPEAVWGSPIYPYPSMYYPPGAGFVSFGTGLALGAIWGGSWNNWGWNSGWGHNNVYINHHFINRNHFQSVNVGKGNSWIHNPGHRGGVPIGQRPTAGQIQQRLGQGNIGSGKVGQGIGNANRLGPGNPGQGLGNRHGQGNQIGQSNRHGEGNIGQGQRFGQGAPSRGSANRIAPSHNFGSHMNWGGSSHRGGGGFRGGGGSRRGGGGRRR